MTKELEGVKCSEVNGHCSKCGNCCDVVPLPITKQEAFVIAEYVKFNKIERQNRQWVNEDKPKVIDLHCCFYNATNKCCTIYAARPMVCKLFKCSHSPETLDINKNHMHKVAYYNHISGQGELSNLTNFDALIYGDIKPLAIYMRHVMNMPQNLVLQTIASQMSDDTFGILKQNI